MMVVGVMHLRVGDLFEGIHAEIAQGETYDVIGVFGILYHIMDHFALFQLLRTLKPKLVIVDSEFILRDNPMIQLILERTDYNVNAAPQYPGQKMALKGVPTFVAMEAIADSLNYDLVWSDWDIMPQEDRWVAPDYFRPKAEKKRRATCALRLRDR